MKRRAAEDARAARLREVYGMLGIGVVGHKDGTLEVTWGIDCRETLAPTCTTLRAHFKTWCDRCGVSVKRTVFYVGFLHFDSALVSLRHPNGGFEMRS